MVNLNVLAYIPYKKIIEGKEIEKISIKTEKVMNSKSFKEIYNLLSSSRNVYQIYNDKFHWPKILSTIPEQGEIIYHMDYSENLSQAYKSMNLNLVTLTNNNILYIAM